MKKGSQNGKTLSHIGDIAGQLGLPITAAQQKRVDAASAIRLDSAEPDEIGYLHAALAQVFFPRRKQEGREYVGKVGSTSVLITAGKAYSGGQWVLQPMPYGAKARLVLVNLISSAVKTGSAQVDVGKSTHEFMQRLGVSGQGSEYRALRKQIGALAAAHVDIGYRGADGLDHTVDGKLITDFSMFATRDERQVTIWPQTVTLSEKFFQSVQEHAVPLDMRAVQALKGSALSLDVYAFLAYRLYRVPASKPLSLSWGLLRYQFGPEFKDMRDFRREMRRSLRQVLAVYPGAKVAESEGGLDLRQSFPPIERRLIPGVR